MHRELTQHPLQNKNLLVAVSGGVDSIVLLECLERLQKALKYSIAVAHVHHGILTGEHSKSINTYRNQTSHLVHQLCKRKKIHFITNTQPFTPPPQSEAALRQFRYQCFKKFIETLKQKATLSKPYLIALAHHQNDLIETRLIRLLRGTGGQGLKAMQVLEPPLLRPLLNCSKAQIIEYAQKNKLQWIEDPCQNNFRHWLRHNWLQSLEQKKPGAGQALGRSLQLLADAITKPQTESNLNSKPHDVHTDHIHHSTAAPELNRAYLLTLTLSQRRQCVAQYMWQLKLRGYTMAHVDELLKHLNRHEEKFDLVLLKHRWQFSKTSLKASPLLT